MATVRLDNLIKPKQVNTQQTKISEDTYDGVTFTDLHLDLTMAKATGIETRRGFANDIRVDFDEDAIKNAVYNCIYTKPGEKVLSPNFGMELERFLFEPVSKSRGEYIGRYVLSTLSSLENRIIVQEVKVTVDPDSNTYNILVIYEIPSLKKKSSTDILLQSKFNSK
jgi:phage baseplate assembly protein W